MVADFDIKDVVAIMLGFLVFCIVVQQAVFYHYVDRMGDAAYTSDVISPATGKVTYGTVYLMVRSGCVIPITEGWNFISLCSNMTNTSVDYVFENVSYRYIMEWNQSPQEFLVYSPRAAENPFTELNKEYSYFVYVYGIDYMDPPGPVYDDVAVNVPNQGWNAPFYPYDRTGNISAYLYSIDGKYRYVMKWDHTLKEFKIYSPRA